MYLCWQFLFHEVVLNPNKWVWCLHIWCWYSCFLFFFIFSEVHVHEFTSSSYNIICTSTWALHETFNCACSFSNDSWYLQRACLFWNYIVICLPNCSYKIKVLLQVPLLENRGDITIVFIVGRSLMCFLHLHPLHQVCKSVYSSEERCCIDAYLLFFALIGTHYGLKFCPITCLAGKMGHPIVNQHTVVVNQSEIDYHISHESHYKSKLKLFLTFPILKYYNMYSITQNR